MKQFFIISLLLIFSVTLRAQELQVRLSVNSNKVGTQVDKKIFQTLQTALATFLNNRKWTKDTYSANEKIQCNFLISIDQVVAQNVYNASLTVQVARPVYNTAYQSPLINFMDNDLVFRYVEFQPLEFNENRVQGNDPLAANLTAVLAYYVNIILGMDYDSFAPKGGSPYFQKALNIVNNAPEGRDIVGWKTFDGVRNRYRLVENLTDNRFNTIHDAIYAYYRQGFDLIFESDETARTGIVTALNYLSTLNKDFPNSMVLQFFMQGKSDELVKLFSKAPRDVKQQARDILSRIDVSNTEKYKELR